MKFKMNLLLVPALLLGLACKKKDTPENNKTFRITESLTVDGLTRTYLINLPPNYYDAKDFSLVIALHGGGGSGSQFEKTSLLTDKANQSKFIVVYPDGLGGTVGLSAARTWNAGLCCGYAVTNNINDVKFISLLIDKLVASYKINPKKVYATGHSNGGMMAYRLACELSNKIAAIAVNSCTMVTNQDCQPSRAVPILHVHSVQDQKVPVNGGFGDGPSQIDYPSVLSGLQKWSALNHCLTPQQTIIDNPNYTFYEWTNCNNNSTIQYYLTKDGGHSWAGGLKGSFMGDEPSTAVSTNNLLWDFFQQYQLP
jgi:polyhydroxybutyrate depolymerase